MLTAFKQTLKRKLPQGVVRAISKGHRELYLLMHPTAMRTERQDRRLRLAFDVLNCDAGPGVIILRPGVQMSVSPAAIDSFKAFCWGSPRMIRELDEFLAQAHGRRQLLDVGAFHGVFSLAFCAASGGLASAVAFEPSPAAFPVLRDNFALNPGLTTSAEHLALGDHCGELEMAYDWNHVVAVPTIHRERCEQPPQSPPLRLPVMTLDAFCRQRNLVPDVLKIDVEGGEYQVLRGGSEFLRAHRPLLFIEVHRQRLGAYGIAMKEFWQILRDIGYDVFDLDGQRLATVEALPDDEPFNIICRGDGTGLGSAAVETRL